METISLGLKVHPIAWVVLKDKFVPEVEGVKEKHVFLTKREDAEMAIKYGYDVLELDWCGFQTLISQMMGGY